jgi:type IV pilus assembly protein PilB
MSVSERIKTEEKWLAKLAELGLITEEQKQNALGEKKSSRERLFDILLKRQYISERDLTVFLSQELGMPIINPLTFKIEPEVLHLVPLSYAKRYHIMPLLGLNGKLKVATPNPLNLILLDDLAALTGLKIEPVLTMPSLIDDAIKKFYTLEAATESEGTNLEDEDFVKELEEARAAGGKLRKSDALDLAKEAQETPVIKIVNLVLLDAIKRRASDLFMEPWEKYMRVRCRVDGLLEEVKRLPGSMVSAVVSRVKVMSHLDIAERRIPQDGRFKARVQNREIDFRVSILPTQFGEKVCIRLLDKKSQSQAMEALGFSEDELKKIRLASSKPHGMILITGPTGSGKTTTLYSILNYLHRPEKNITTVEDPVEYQVHGINQVNVREAVGLTFAGALRGILRQDPNIIMVGEIRDLETMDIAMKAALTGHLVLSTLHTNDAASSIVRMMNMGIEPFLIASSVIMVTAQRLLRRICDICKEPFQPDAELLKTLRADLRTRSKLYKPKGCPECRNTGYAGRRVITEVLEITPKVRDLVVARATGTDIKQMARKEGMRTLRECGLAKVLAGETTFEEVLRITASDQELEG